MQQTQTTLPDVTSQSNLPAAPPLKWVGMEQIGLPVRFELNDGTIVSSNAKVDIFVSLDTAAKGIHMSRLYLNLNEALANQVVTEARLNTLLDVVLASHEGLSDSAMIKLECELPINKKALLSQHSGYQVYPVVITHQRNSGTNNTTLDLTIPYSSTCPCSNSLATQLVAEAISEKFQEENLSKEALLEWLTSRETKLATPHNQRSYAYINLQLAEHSWFNLEDLIFSVESTIGTPVQTAVKRQDEQEFARLNGSNLMFCEDAARKVKKYLETLDQVSDYWFKVEHQESLHAHNAVVIDQKFND